jgi:hypothetical protein
MNLTVVDRNECLKRWQRPARQWRTKMPLYFDPFLKIDPIPDGGVQSLAVDPTNPNAGSGGHTDGSVRFLQEGIEHYNTSSFQIISAGKDAHFEQTTPLFSEDDTFDFSQSTTEPTAGAGKINFSEVAIVKRTDSTAPSVDYESFQFADNAGTDGKGYVLTSIQHGTTDTSLVDQSGTEASSRLFVGNLTLDSQASAGGEDSWGLWQINVEPNQYDPDAFANDLYDPPTGPAVATETLTIVHEGFWV